MNMQKTMVMSFKSGQKRHLILWVCLPKSTKPLKPFTGRKK